MRAWQMKVRRPHPASRTVHSACEIAAGPRRHPCGAGQLSRAREHRETTGGLPPVHLQRTATLNPRTRISRVYNSPRARIPKAATLRNDLT